jgi:drug/metabolite transporter (DMT)-like permease
MEWFRRTRQEISRRIAETPAPGRWPGIVVVVVGLLLTGWFVLDGLLGNPALPEQYQLVQAYMLLLAALACLVAVVATLVALVGVWSTPLLWVAAVGFGSAALLSLLAQLLLMTLFTGWSWDLLFVALVFIPSLVSLALALVCAWLARTARWRWPW